MRRRLSPVLTLLLIFMHGEAAAEWTKQLEIDYVIGDGENRIGARQAAIEHLKQKASDQVGTYIQSTTTLQNGQLAETIQVLGASLVRVSDAVDTLTVDRAGHLVLNVKAKLTVDDLELAKRVELLQQDRKKAEQIEQLSAENAELARKLGQIRDLLKQEHNLTKTAELLSQQDAALRKITGNGQAASLIFERGTLVQMAAVNSVEFDKAKKVIDDRFYAEILDNPVRAEIQAVQADGDEYLAKVRVKWALDDKAALLQLSRYLQVNYEKGFMYIPKALNSNRRGPHPLSEQMYDYLMRNGIDLRVKLGAKELRIPVLFGDSSFITPCTDYRREGLDARRLCLVTLSGEEKQPNWMSGQNLLNIRLTKNEAVNSTSVEAAFVMSTNLVPAKY